MSAVIVTDGPTKDNLVELKSVFEVTKQGYLLGDDSVVPLAGTVLWLGLKDEMLRNTRSQDMLGSKVGPYFISGILEDGWHTSAAIAKMGVGPVICTCVSNSMLSRYYFKDEIDAIAAQALVDSL